MLGSSGGGHLLEVEKRERTAVVWKEKVIRSGEKINCNYEDMSDPDLCNFKVMRCLNSEHKLMPDACKEDMVMDQPDWPAFVFYLYTLRTDGIKLHVMSVVNSNI